MSHVSTIDVVISDLPSLKVACEELGLEFRENQTKYKWYNSYVGDAPLPQGFTEEDLGKCEHAIGVAGNPVAYEVGVVHNKIGQGFSLMYDSWQGGYGLENMIGKDACKLKQAYASAVAVKIASKTANLVNQFVKTDGSRVYEFVPRGKF